MAATPYPHDGPGAYAVGWATVELDRAARELRMLLEPGAVFEPADDSRALGARCRVGRVARVARVGPGAPGSIEASLLVLLEPSTEGRLAAALARRGEGWCARWDVAATPDAGGMPDASGWRPGPLGVEWLAFEPASDGTFRLFVRPATIDR